MTESDFADPSNLDAGGRSLWNELSPLVQTSDGLVILLEACRCKDRLDRFDALLRGDIDTWATIKLDGNDQPVELMIDKAASLATSTQNMMKQLLVVLRLPDVHGKKTGREQRIMGAHNSPGVSSIERAKARARSA